jgi:hypothetical protein
MKDYYFIVYLNMRFQIKILLEAGKFRIILVVSESYTLFFYPR